MFEDKEKKYIKELEETRKELEEEKKRAEEEKKRAEEEHLKLVETAKFLKSLNIDIQIIANKTGLSLQEVEKL